MYEKYSCTQFRQHVVQVVARVGCGLCVGDLVVAGRRRTADDRRHYVMQRVHAGGSRQYGEDDCIKPSAEHRRNREETAGRLRVCQREVNNRQPARYVLTCLVLIIIVKRPTEYHANEIGSLTL